MFARARSLVHAVRRNETPSSGNTFVALSNIVLNKRLALSTVGRNLGVGTPAKICAKNCDTANCAIKKIQVA